MAYFKGKIIKIQDLEENVTIISSHYGASRVSDALIDNNEYEKIDKLKNNILKYSTSTTVFEGEIYNIINKYKKYFVYYCDGEDVIYEKIIDKSGNKFAKEIVTGLIFPLGICTKSYIIHHYFLPSEIYTLYTKNRVYVKRGNKIFTSDDEVVSFDSNLDFSNYDEYWFYITSRIAKSNEVMNFINCCVCKKKEIEEKEVKDYLRKHSFFNKRKFVNKIENLYNSNSFIRKVELKEQKEVIKKDLISQDKLTIVMENIEYMLSRIKIINIDLYNKYYSKYENLLKSEENTIHLTPFDYRSFILLEADIQLTLGVLKRNTSTIMDYLNSLKEEYIDNLLNKSNNKTDITISEIDIINELFLKSKDNYSIIDQRMILKEFAIIYFLELLENKDNEYNLDNSYFKMHLKTIMMYINTFIELGIVKSNILIDLEDEISLDNILKIIDSLEVSINIEKEGVLKLIK